MPRRDELHGGLHARNPWWTARSRTVMPLVRLAAVVGSNVVALLVVDRLFDSVAIDRWWPIVVGAIVLGFANSILKPVLALLTLPLIVVSLGIGYFAIAVGMLALAEWVAPDFSIDGFWTYVGATIVVWLVNLAVGWVLHLVSGGSPRLRAR